MPESNRRGDLAALGFALGAVVLMALVLVAKDRGFFWHCDFQLWYTPIYEEMVRAWRQGEWPLLTQSSWTTGNLAGEYQCGTFSVFQNALLLMVWALPLATPAKAAALAIVQMGVLAAGTVLLARRRGAPPAGAAMAGLLAAANGWIVTWAASQWIVALAGFAWVPWCWWALEVAAETKSERARWLLPGVFVYLVLAAGSPFAVLMLLVVMGWLALRWRSWRMLGPMLIGGTLGLALSAPAWLALVNFHRLSTRAEWGEVWQWSWRVPWRAWLGLVCPGFRTPWQLFWGNWDQHTCLEMAGGLVPLAAIGWTVVKEPREFWRRWRWELGLLAVAVVLVSVPMLGSFRWSFRNLPLFFLVLGLVSTATRTWLAPALTAATLLASFWFLPTTESAFVHPFAENLRTASPLDERRLYLGVWSYTDLQDGAKEPAEWGALLRPCNTMMAGNLHFLNGYSSFTARGVAETFEVFGTVRQAVAESLVSEESAPLLDLLGVDGIVFGPAYFALAEHLGPEWRLAMKTAEAKVYHRERVRFSPVKTLTELEDRPGVHYAQPHLTVRENGRQTVTVELVPNPDSEPNQESAEDIGLLMEDAAAYPVAIAFARPFYPGYEATLRGLPVPVRSYAGVIPVVELPPNAQGTLVLRYRPAWLKMGALSAFSGLAAMLALWRGGAPVKARQTSRRP